MVSVFGQGCLYVDEQLIDIFFVRFSFTQDTAGTAGHC
jgi:hypothetical protein